MGLVKNTYNWHGSNRPMSYDSKTFEHLGRGGFPIYFEDDFLGYQAMLTETGSTGPWKVAETNINTTTALVANEPNGVVAIIGDSDDNAETGTLYWGDQVSLSCLRNLVMECRVTCHVLPTTGTETSEIAWGLTSAIQSDLDSAATNMQFKAVSSANTTLLYESDDGTTDDDDNTATGITLVADTYIITRIECIDGTYARFYVDGALVGATDISAITTSTDNVQPFFRFIKAKSSVNTAVGTLYVDYCRIWQDRSA
jgi:hypothetical protein